MQKMRNRLATLFIGGLSLCLFIVGVVFFMLVLVSMTLVGLLVKPETRARWKQRWMQKWQTRQTGFYQKRDSAMARSSNTRVIEGEYTIK